MFDVSTLSDLEVSVMLAGAMHLLSAKYEIPQTTITNVECIRAACMEEILKRYDLGEIGNAD